MKNKNTNNLTSVIIKSFSVWLIFGFAVLVSIGAVFLYNIKGEFVKAFTGSVYLSYKFYLWTFVVIFLSSLIYTPVSFGISDYIIKSKNKKISVWYIFNLFTKPRLLFKAVLINTLKRIIVFLWRIVILTFALLVECVIFIISVLLSGQNIFDYERDFLQSAAKLVMSNDFFVMLTVVEWIAVICVFTYIKMKYIMCKYVFLTYSSVGVLEALRMAKYIISDNMNTTLSVYAKSVSAYVIAVCSLGLVKINSEVGFSNYATKLVKLKSEKYFKKRSC